MKMEHFDSALQIEAELPGSPKGHWQNWSKNQNSQPETLFHPTNSHELAAFLRSHQGKLRVVGSGHSFSPLVNTDHLLISLNKMTGIIDHDHTLHTAKVQAGTPLHLLGKSLNQINQAMINLGDIDHQSIAGAVATGTHGTGAELSCISGLVKGFTLVTPKGESIHCSTNENQELFNGGRVNLGSLGIFSEIELQNRPSYHLEENISIVPLRDVLAHIDRWKEQHRHIEFFAFGYSDQVILKTLNITDKPSTSVETPLISEDALLKLFCEITRFAPKLTSFVHKQISRFISPSNQVGPSNQVFATPRSVRFNEMEYQVAAESGPECIDKVIHHIRKHKLNAFFPIEYRYVAGDNIWLSPFYNRDSASISIHQYHKQSYQYLFNSLEPIFDHYQGRPHWGKLHSKTTSQLEPLYPKWQAFKTLRKQLDPKGQLLSPAMEKVFGH